MKYSAIALLLASVLTLPSAYATGVSDAAFKTCSAKAIQNVEAISKLMYDGKLDSSQTEILSSSRSDLVFKIYTSESGTEGLNCIYRVRMNANVTDDCWLISLEQTECSA